MNPTVARDLNLLDIASQNLSAFKQSARRALIGFELQGDSWSYGGFIFGQGQLNVRLKCCSKYSLKFWKPIQSDWLKTSRQEIWYRRLFSAQCRNSSRVKLSLTELAIILVHIIVYHKASDYLRKDTASGSNPHRPPSRQPRQLPLEQVK